VPGGYTLPDDCNFKIKLDDDGLVQLPATLISGLVEEWFGAGLIWQRCRAAPRFLSHLQTESQPGPTGGDTSNLGSVESRSQFSW
jgi:hypothetical protein